MPIKIKKIKRANYTKKICLTHIAPNSHPKSSFKKIPKSDPLNTPPHLNRSPNQPPSEFIPFAGASIIPPSIDARRSTPKSDPKTQSTEKKKRRRKRD